MGFVNGEKPTKHLPDGLPGWATLGLLAFACLTVIYLAFRMVTGSDPLHFIDRKGMVLVGVADDIKKKVTE